MKIYLGENLKRLRSERAITQETLADFLGVSFQAVSKWERGESCPDIEMLPAIASFFNTTTDDLLGVDKVERESKIQYYIDKYNVLYGTDTPKALQLMKKAVYEFPGDFRLLIRYFEALIMGKGGLEEGLAILHEAQSVYDRIDSCCTDDSIRIWAQRLMATYCKSMSLVKGSGLGLDDMEKILHKMPDMYNSGDFAATYLYPSGEKHREACRNAIDELMYLFCCAVINYCSDLGVDSAELKIEGIKTLISVLDSVYTDGNYRKSWVHVIYDYGHLGSLYFIIGNTEEALKNLRICAELSKKYDSLPQTVTSSSVLFNGKEFTKKKRKITYCERMREKMMNEYDFSDEFRQSDKFKEILKILE